MAITSGFVQHEQPREGISFFIPASDEVTLNTFVTGGQDLPFPYHGHRKATFAELEDGVEILRGSVPARCRLADDFQAKDEPVRLLALREVAVAGSALFKTIMQDSADREQFRKLMAEHPNAVLKATGNAAVVPWEAMCLAETPNDATIEDFLGWGHPVWRAAPQHGRLRAHRLQATTPARTGLVEDNRLDTVRLGINRQRNPLVSGGQFEEAPNVIVDNDFDELRKFMANVDVETAFGVFHFDCDLNHSPKPHGIRNSSFGVRTGFNVRYDVLDQLPIYNGPFLFFNVCNGGSVEFGTATSYAGQLIEKGADCVIAAETKIGDDFAADFAGRVYRYAISGSTVSEALFAARREVLSQSMNPFALFFSLYGLPDMRLQPPVPMIPAQGDNRVPA